MNKAKQNKKRGNPRRSAEKRNDLPAGKRNEESSSAGAPSSAPVTRAPETAAGGANRAPSRTGKRRKIGDALRERGFDEQTVASHYVDVAQRLKGKSDTTGNVEKLLIDVLKECSKFLEPARPDRAGGGLGEGAPVHVHLVHNVTRPQRDERGRFTAKTESPEQSVPGGANSAANGNAAGMDLRESPPIAAARAANEREGPEANVVGERIAETEPSAC